MQDKLVARRGYGQRGAGCLVDELAGVAVRVGDLGWVRQGRSFGRWVTVAGCCGDPERISRRWVQVHLGPVAEHHNPQSVGLVGEHDGPKTHAAPAVADEVMPAGPVGHNPEAVAISILNIATGHRDARGGHQPVKRRRNDGTHLAAPAVEPQPGVAGHICGGGDLAAVADSIFHPGCRNEGVVQATGTVVMQEDVTGGHAVVGAMGDNRFAGVHPQRFQHPLPDRAAVIQAGHVLQQPAQQLVGGVGVVEPAAGFPGGLGVTQGVTFVSCGGSEVGAGGQAGGMAQQVPERDRAVARGQGQPGQVRADRGVEVEPAGRHQLQQRQGGHRLADAADLEGGVGEHRAPSGQIGVAHAGGEERLPPVGQSNGDPRRRHGGEPPPKVLGEGREVP